MSKLRVREMPRLKLFLLLAALEASHEPDDIRAAEAELAKYGATRRQVFNEWRRRQRGEQ